MGMVCGGAKVAVVKSVRASMHCDAYASELDAVLAMVDNGTLGGGGAYGDEAHIAALSRVEAQIKDVRSRIAEMATRDASGDYE